MFSLKSWRRRWLEKRHRKFFNDMVLALLWEGSKDEMDVLRKLDWKTIWAFRRFFDARLRKLSAVSDPITEDGTLPKPNVQDM